MGFDVGQVAPRDIRGHLRIVSCWIFLLTCCVEELQLLPNGGARTLPHFVLERAAHAPAYIPKTTGRCRLMWRTLTYRFQDGGVGRYLDTAR